MNISDSPLESLVWPENWTLNTENLDIEKAVFKHMVAGMNSFIFYMYLYSLVSSWNNFATPLHTAVPGVNFPSISVHFCSSLNDNVYAAKKSQRITESIRL